MKTFKKLILNISLIFICLFSACEVEKNIEKNNCEKLKNHISSCLLDNDRYMVYIDDWDLYCMGNDTEKLIEMDCKQIKNFYFGE
jgi:hypothetical protein